MTIWDYLASWAGRDSVLLAVLGLTLKSAIVSALGLQVSHWISPSRPDLRNLLLRQTLLLAVLLPLFAAASSLIVAGTGARDLPTWSLIIPFATEITAVAGVDSAGPNLFAYMQSLLLILILGGSALAILRVCYGFIQVRRITRASRVCTDHDLNDLLGRVRLRATILQPIRMIFSGAASIPLACGIFRHSIVLPEDARAWSLREVEMVLQHEAMHIHRRDNLWGLVAAVATAIHWYNPLIWIVRRQMLLEAERCCDGVVVHHGGNPSDYARLLLTLARSACVHKESIAQHSHILGFKLLEVRIMSILQAQIKVTEASSRVRRATLLCTLIFMLPIATLELSGAEPSPPLSADRVSTAQTGSDDSKNPPPSADFVKVDLQPVMLTNASPVYPDSARKAGIEGSVWVQVLVDTSGSVAEAKVMKTSGHTSLDDSAIAAARKSTFEAAKADGKKVRVWVAYEIKFQLKKK